MFPAWSGPYTSRTPNLDGQNPAYRIEPGGDLDRFTITDGNHLSMVSAAADRTTYVVTIAISTAGDTVFEDGNNRRVIEVALVDPRGGSP